MRRATTTLAATTALLLAAPVCGQFLNRAVYLGADEEGVRRDFRQGREYFLDRMSYVSLAPWWDRGLLRFQDEVQYRFGSVSSTDFTVEGHIDHALDLGDGVAFRYHVLHGEHRDTRFIRNAIGLEYATSDTTAVFAQGTPFGDKERIDISVGGWLHRDGDDALRVMLTLVDAPSEKSDTAVYEQSPYGLHLAGTFGDRDSHRIAFELGAQLPFEQRRLADDQRFEMQRYIGTVQTHLVLDDDDRLVAALESEWTDKDLRPAAANDPLRERFDRTFQQVRVEWWRDGPRPWSVGFVHTYHSEHGRRPNDPANDLRTLRREWMVVARCQVPIDGRLSLEPQLFAGHVEDRFFDGVEDRASSGFEGKIAWNARWDFSPNVTLALIVSTQLDEFAFGGGGAQFVARF
ncbi:MAG: hypothetical protein KAI24_03790 [Planctomycetes bacterium]|nr:hypothetical protein [Planctomycetota bacterium]